MVRSIKKIFSLVFVIMGLSSSSALPMISRIVNRGSTASRAAAIAAQRARPSMARRLLPNPTIRESLSQASQAQIQAQQAIASEPQEVTPAKPVVAKIEPKKPAPIRAQAQKKSVQSGQTQVQPAAQAPMVKQPTESARDIVQRILKKYGKAPINEPSMGAAAKEIAQSPSADLIVRPKPIIAKHAMEGKKVSQDIQTKAKPVVKARVVYTQAMNALNPVLNALEQLQNAKLNDPIYPKLHNKMREALIAARNKGYSIGFVDKQVVQKIGGLPGSQVKLLENQSGKGAAMIPAQALGVVGVAQTSGLARVLGLQGDFVPFVAPIKGALAKDAVFEIIRPSLTSPLHVDHSKIIIQPMAQVTPPVGSADMQLAKLPGGAADGNSLQGSETPNQKLPHIPGVPTFNGGASVPPAMNVLRNFGGISSEPSQSDEEVEKEVEEQTPVPSIQEPEEVQPKESRDGSAGHSRGIQSPRILSQEELAMAQYGNLILQALAARTYLQMQWAGQSSSLQVMFADYNALLTRYRQINDLFSNAKYTDSNQRIYTVVSMVLEGMKSAKN